MKLKNSLWGLVLMSAPLFGAKFTVFNPNNVPLYVTVSKEGKEAEAKEVAIPIGQKKTFDTKTLSCFKFLTWRTFASSGLYRINVESPKIMLTGKISLYANGTYDKSFSKKGEMKSEVVQRARAEVVQADVPLYQVDQDYYGG